MKKTKLTILASLAFLPVLTMAASTLTFETPVPVDHVYIPSGFDNNDNTEVVVTGFLPNLCYKAPKSSISVKNNLISVDVKAIKTKVDMSFCVNIVVPYMEIISIGSLDKGTYNIAVNANSNWEKKSSIKISEASSNSIDDAIYANVDQIERGEAGSRKIFLKGYNPSDCFELKEIVIIDNGVDTFSILPKMKQVRAACPKKMMPFSYEMEVPQNLESEQVLLHVRVMDGRSVNILYNNRP